MLKNAAFFTAGALTMVVVGIAYGLISTHRASNAMATSSGPVTAIVTIRVAQDPQALLPIKDVSDLLERIAGLTVEEKDKIREAVASNLVSEVRIESTVDGESRWIAVDPKAPNLLLQGSVQARFGPVELPLEKREKKPNHEPAEPTAPSGRGAP